ncbi:Beta N-acetyl-glucosaminidase [gamma proteobacterium IMCC2047]|nr:Beta N-acetyl-glucosaminidase [gamma proteobacterium IMCC2047]
MSLGPLMLDIDGLSTTPDDRQLLAQPQVGGIILFARNYQSPAQLAELIAEIRAVRPEIVIAVDQEGGRVQRLKEGFTRLPPMAVFGKLYETDPAKAKKLAYQAGWLMAAEVLAEGIDLSFAPVLDVDCGLSDVIGDRAFAQCPQVLTTLSGAFIEGMHKAGMVATAKHYPGHGSVKADSHIAIPVDERPFADIDAQDLQPFRALSSLYDAVMPAHVIYRAVDEKPAGFSRYWLQTLLREEMAFDGVIFSDDLSMEGASVAGSFAERAEAALEAGCDMVLVCNNRDAALEVLDYLNQTPIQPSQRLARLAGKGVFSREKLRASQQWHDAVAAIAPLTDES